MVVMQLLPVALAVLVRDWLPQVPTRRQKVMIAAPTDARQRTKVSGARVASADGVRRADKRGAVSVRRAAHGGGRARLIAGIAPAQAAKVS